MSDTTNKPPKVYVPKSSAKARQTSFGEVLRLSFRVEDAVAFFTENANEKGYINLELIPRKSASQYGDTHTVSLDTWKPTPRAEGAPATGKPAARTAAPRAAAAPAQTAETEEDDIPF